MPAAALTVARIVVDGIDGGLRHHDLAAPAGGMRSRSR